MQYQAHKFKTAHEELLRIKNENEQNISFMQAFKTTPKTIQIKTKDKHFNINRGQPKPTLIQLKNN